MIEIVAPIVQRHWKWPAVVNFFFGGSACGLFLHLFWNSVILKNPSVDQTTAYIHLLPVLIALTGFLALIVEAGRPLRSHYLMHHLKRSWMSREALFGSLFIGLTIGYALTNLATWAYAAAAAALLFMLSQGYIVAHARAIGGWNSDAVVMLFFTSGICSGYGLWMILHIIPQGLTGNPWVTWGFIAILINVIAWGGYLWLPQNRGGGLEPKPKKAMSICLGVLDGIVPLLALVGIYFSGMAAETAKVWFVRLGLCCGLSLCLGGWLKLHHLVTKAGWMRPVTAEITSYPPRILPEE